MESPYVIASSANNATRQVLMECAAPVFKAVDVQDHGDLDTLGADVLILDEALIAEVGAEPWFDGTVTVLIDAGLSLAEPLPSHAISLTQDLKPVDIARLAKLAAEHSRLRLSQKRLNTEMMVNNEGAALLVEVGIALSVEQNLDKLLAKILSEGRRLACCDAASLFLVDRSDEKQPRLSFKLTQNASVPVSFEEHSIALTESSIVGYCALSGEVLNIDDTYHISGDVPYRFNSSFDKVMGYRTVSLLAIPMKDHDGVVVGVLEFINRKRSLDAKLTNVSEIERQVIPFESAVVDLMRALSSQAAIAIENRKLIDDINQLFDGFVNASVYAIEQRDPCTSGHSFRVASLSEELAATVSQHGSGLLRNVSFSSQQIRELRFAALLHDFGKVGVRENVLVKAKKLPSQSIEIMKYRIALSKQQLQLQYKNQLLSMYESGQKVSEAVKQKLKQALQEDIQLLDDYLAVILAANEPSVLTQGKFELLEAIRGHLFTDYDGSLRGLLSDGEFASLSILRGSLNDNERREIESHVTHTVNFLNHIPWTAGLKDIPNIAGAHHEKLDGSGYPNNLTSEEIPYQSRIMTVCDIYDALTASDRPYKPAVSLDKALNILESEAQSGLLDTHIVKVFIEGKVYHKAEKSTVSAQDIQQGYAHHVCDFDLRPRD